MKDIRKKAITGLHDFVKRGGGLIMFLGDQVSPAIVNQKFQHGGTHLVPAKLLSIKGGTRGARKVWHIDPQVPNHPLAKPVTILPPQVLQFARVYKYFKVQPYPGARVIIKLSETGDPLLVEKDLGRGKIVLITTTADREWTDLPIHQLYLMLLHQVITYLTSEFHEGRFLVGESIAIPAGGKTKYGNAVVIDPTGKPISVSVALRGGERTVEMDDPRHAGFYEVHFAGPAVPNEKTAPGGKGSSTASSSVPMVFAVNVDPIESDVSTLGPGDLLASLAKLKIRILHGDQDLLLAIEESRVGREIWRPIFFLALAIFVIEACLARFFSLRSAKKNEESEASQARLVNQRAAGLA